MLEQIDTNSLAGVLSAIDQTYTDELGWDAATDEVSIEGAVIDEVHHQLFNGDPPVEFAAPYVYDPMEEPRKILTKHRRQEIRAFLQRKWQGPGGVILAEEMIGHAITKVLSHHRERHSLDR